MRDPWALMLVGFAVMPARAWQTKIAVAPAGTPTGLAALSLLQKISRHKKTMDVRAICRNAAEERACRQAICGCRVVDGGTPTRCLQP